MVPDKYFSEYNFIKPGHREYQFRTDKCRYGGPMLLSHLLMIEGYFTAGLVIWVPFAQCLSPLMEAATIYNEGMEAYAALHGMKLDVYHVVTADKWRLQIHRVRSPDIFNRTVSTPVLISHGTTVSSADYMMNPRRESLAFILADNGYDVFAINHRGNQFSNQKVTSSGSIVTAKGKDMYETAWQFMAQYDIPAALEWILEETGQDKIHIIGHSQGGPAVLGFFAGNHSYDDRIGKFVALTPTIWFEDMSLLLEIFPRMFAPIVELLPKFLFEELMEGRILASFQAAANGFIYPFCYFIPGVFKTILNVFLQRGFWNVLTLTPYLEDGRITILSTIYPGGQTVMDMYFLSSHYWMTQGAWTKIDYRKIPQTGLTNEAMYNSTEPPVFNFTDVRINTSMVFVKNDVFLSLKTAQKIIDWLKPSDVLIIDDDRLSHVDLAWSWKAPCLAYWFILKQFTDFDDARGPDYVQYRQSVAKHLETLEEPRCATQHSV